MISLQILSRSKFRVCRTAPHTKVVHGCDKRLPNHAGSHSHTFATIADFVSYVITVAQPTSTLQSSEYTGRVLVWEDGWPVQLSQPVAAETSVAKTTTARTVRSTGLHSVRVLVNYFRGYNLVGESPLWRQDQSEDYLVLFTVVDRLRV